MDTSEKPLTASIRHIARFLKSGRPIYNLEVPNTDGRKSRITQATAKRFAFGANTISILWSFMLMYIWCILIFHNYLTQMFYMAIYKTEKTINCSTAHKTLKTFHI